MNRDQAWQLLNEWTKNPRLIGHALAVEAAMRQMARKYGHDEERWGVTGLLHDFDYEQHPTIPEHPLKGSEVLKAHGCPDDIREAILGHASLVPRATSMARSLYAVDELSGLVVATALVRPNRSIFEVDVDSVRKKMKDKRFAAGVNREDVVQGAEELGVPLDELIADVIEGLKSAAEALGLQGAPQG
jgi:putative nucleotidyltransferase with HDIG domain